MRTVEADSLQAEDGRDEQREDAKQLVDRLHPALLCQVALELQLPGRLPRHAPLDIEHDARQGDDERQRQRRPHHVLDHRLQRPKARVIDRGRPRHAVVVMHPGWSPPRMQRTHLSPWLTMTMLMTAALEHVTQGMGPAQMVAPVCRLNVFMRAHPWDGDELGQKVLSQRRECCDHKQELQRPVDLHTSVLAIVSTRIDVYTA